MRIPILIFSLMLFLQVACQDGVNSDTETSTIDSTEQVLDDVATPRSLEPLADKTVSNEIVVGAAQLEKYLPLLEGKKISLVVNQTSKVGSTHLVDLLLQNSVNIQSIFAPEHGFRGKADAGAKIKNGIDTKTGLPLVSLYGKNKKPTAQMLKGVDVVVFDIQDVGARFYTYISTMHYVMEACAEQGISVLILDRPNPNGHYVDGPIREKSLKSFVGMHPIPVVHGMTVGELAQMINGEQWLKNSAVCDITIIPSEHYNHTIFYELPVKPSPNLPNIRSIYLYPHLCFFEGTTVSIGRGTPTPFQIYGTPKSKIGDFTFTPKSTEGATNPKHKGKVCNGFDLTQLPIEELQQINQLQLEYLVQMYQNDANKKKFFIPFFEKLAGTKTLRKQIQQGLSAAEIRATWASDLQTFKAKRKTYLLYKDFE